MCWKLTNLLGVALLVMTTYGSAAVAQTETAKPTQPSVTVGEGGVLLKDGMPYRGIGVNYFDAFSRTLENPGDTSYRKGFEELAKRGIPFVRFMACGFWPADWKPYFSGKEDYFKRMDGVVRAAEEYGVGLIPSLCWHYPTIPDLVGESCNQWGNPDSKTIAFMEQYVREVVSRYVDSPAVWAWELGNEYSLAADLPNAAEHRPYVAPLMGTAPSRSEADEITHDMVVSALAEFAKEVRALDKARPITTGNSLPRPAAHHMRTERSWTHDSREEFAANLLAVTPDPVNMASIHLYAFDQKRFDQESAPYAEILSLCVKAAASVGKAVFVGEFGAPDGPEDGGPEKARADALAILDAIEQSKVPLAALWVFDFASQNSTCNVTPTNQRAYLLDAVAEANRRVQGNAAPLATAGAAPAPEQTSPALRNTQ
jgi:hypothetical protein